MSTVSIDKNKNEIFKRTEVCAVLTFDSAVPSRSDIRKHLSAELKAKSELFVISKIDKKYGSQEVVVSASLYSDDITMKGVEQEYMLKKNFPKKDEPSAEKKAEPESKPDKNGKGEDAPEGSEAKAKPEEGKTEDKLEADQSEGASAPAEKVEEKSEQDATKEEPEKKE